MPAAASSYDVSADGKTYTFHLRAGAKWSDGQPVTAKDFVYSFKRILDPAIAADYATFFTDAGIVGAAQLLGPGEGCKPGTLIYFCALMSSTGTFTIRRTLSTVEPRRAFVRNL